MDLQAEKLKVYLHRDCGDAERVYLSTMISRTQASDVNNLLLRWSASRWALDPGSERRHTWPASERLF